MVVREREILAADVAKAVGVDVKLASGILDGLVKQHAVEKKRVPGRGRVNVYYVPEHIKLF